MDRRLSGLIAAVLLLAAVGIPALTQAAKPPVVLAATTSQRLSALESQVADLQRRVSALEGATPSASPSPAPSATPTPTSPSASPTPSSSSASPAPSGTPSSPSPTSTPTLSPSPTPQTSPPPSPQNTPACTTFPTAPSTTADQSAAIASFLVANKGRTVCFAAGATYRTDTRINLDAWSGTVLGQGATFRKYVTPASNSDVPIIRITRSANIVFDGLNVRADATLANIQARTFGSGDHEGDHAFDVESSSNVTIRNATLSNLWGDGVYLRATNSTTNPVDTAPASGITLSNLTISVVGRNGVSFISVDGFTATGVSISDASLHGYDGEPNRPGDVLRNITVRNGNTVRFDAGHTSSGPGYAFVLTPANGGGNPTSVTFTGNTMDRPMVRLDNANGVTLGNNDSTTNGTVQLNNCTNVTGSTAL